MSTQLPFPQFLPEIKWKAPNHFPDLSSAKEICIDVETYDPELNERGPGGVRGKGFVTGYAVGVDGWRGYYPVRHSAGNVALEPVQRWLRHELSRPSQPKVTAYGGYDREWFLADAIPISGVVYDIQIAECLLNEEQDSYSLDSIAFRHLGERKEEALLDEAAKWWSDTKSSKKIMHLLAAGHVGPYAEGDVDKTLRAFQVQKVKLHEQNLWKIFQMESELSEVVHLMRQQGVKIDLDGCERLAKKYKTMEAVLYKQLRDKFFPGRNVDFNSSLDIEHICKAQSYFDYPRTAKGNPSFVGDWMDLQGSLPFLGELFLGISKYRTIEKLRRDFIEGSLLKFQHKGRIHAKFNQMRTEEGGTRSGRFSVCLPNTQQIPQRSEEGKEIRTLFLPDDADWLKHDYSQQEYRIFVHYANVMKMDGAAEAAKIYIDNPQADFHQGVADMTGLPRGDAKNWNFAAIYGAGIDKTALMTKKSKEDAARVNAIYHEKIPYAKKLAKDMSMRASQRGWIKTLGGRVLHFETYEPAYFDDNIYVNGEMIKDAEKSGFRFRPIPYEQAVKKWPGKRLRRGQTHKALNRAVQGSAADMVKMAMLQIYKELKVVPLMQVHDELSHNGDKKLGLQIKEIMQNALKLTVPVYADFSMGKNWGNQVKVTLT